MRPIYTCACENYAARRPHLRTLLDAHSFDRHLVQLNWSQWRCAIKRSCQVLHVLAVLRADVLFRLQRVLPVSACPLPRSVWKRGLSESTDHFVWIYPQNTSASSPSCTLSRSVRASVVTASPTIPSPSAFLVHVRDYRRYTVFRVQSSPCKM